MSISFLIQSIFMKRTKGNSISYTLKFCLFRNVTSSHACSWMSDCIIWMNWTQLFASLQFQRWFISNSATFHIIDSVERSFQIASHKVNSQLLFLRSYWLLRKFITWNTVRNSLIWAHYHISNKFQYLFS